MARAQPPIVIRHPDRHAFEMKDILRFALPLSATSLLQILFKEMGLVIAGKLCGDFAVSAIGATGAITNMVINASFALTVGIHTTAAYLCGSGNRGALRALLRQVLHLLTVLSVALVPAMVLAAGPLLRWLHTPVEIHHAACRYLQMSFLGIPALLLFQGGTAILRGTGNVVQPLKYQLISGLLNLVLDILLAAKTSLGVMAISTAGLLSQYGALLCMLTCLRRTFCSVPEDSGAEQKTRYAAQVLRFGIPALLQSLIFSVSNFSVQSAVNFFGSAAIAGNSAAAGLQAIIDAATASYETTAVGFISRLTGAKQFDKLNRVLCRCVICAVCTGGILGAILCLAPDMGLQIYLNTPESTLYGSMRIRAVCSCMFLCGITEVMTGALRGMGCTTSVMLISLAAGCGIRVLWAKLTVHVVPSFYFLMASYPLSWSATILAMLLLYRFKRHQQINRTAYLSL